MSAEIKLMNTLIAAGLVTRYHQQIGAEAQNDAAHAWGVACLCSIALADIPPTEYLDKLKVVQCALFHDYGELLAGDPSYMLKQSEPELSGLLKVAERRFASDLGSYRFVRDLTFVENSIVEWADMMEAVLWAKHLFEEYGSARYWHVYSNGHAALIKGTVHQVARAPFDADKLKAIGHVAQAMTSALPLPDVLLQRVAPGRNMTPSPFDLI